uniref:ABCG2 n=1 Tax=Prorocentrum lima TaxID=39448 RepID=A0A4P8ETL3_9DINO|nr:ABCG2 [Prorocentrum lima]
MAEHGPIAMEWQNLTYRLPPKRKGEIGRAVLKDAFGKCDPGQLMAILGASGSGKSSLLNALAGRMPYIPKTELAGSILIQAKGGTFYANTVDLPSISAYVEQEDALFALSTVEETLRMFGRFRFPHLREAELMKRVNDVICVLGLNPARNTLVGSDKPGQRGISGGERKRVHLGLELLHKPRLIFVDEPTSGLDSYHALNVMATLKDLAISGHTVVCSIHQPRSSIYQLIDKLILMAEGQVAYFGDCGVACAKHFAKIGYAVPQDFNPADHFLDVTSVDFRTPAQEAKTRQTMEQVIANCPPLGSELMTPKPIGALLPPELAGMGRRHVPFGVAFGMLLKRTWRELTRDKAALAIKYGANIWFTIIFGCVYFQMEKTQTGLQNRSGICFFMAMNQAFGSTIGVAKVIPQQLKVVHRERAAKLYDIFPFYMATFICQLPLELIPQLIFGAAVYTLTGLRPGIDYMLTYVAVLMLENFAGIGLGMVMSASFTKVEQVPQIAPLVIVFFLMFSGLLLNQDDIPSIFRPLKHVSFIRYAFQALTVNELRGNTGFECSGTGLGRRCLQGDDWLDQLSFGEVSIQRSMKILFLEILVFNLLAFRILNGKQPRFMKAKANPNAASKDMLIGA